MSTCQHGKKRLLKKPLFTDLFALRKKHRDADHAREQRLWRDAFGTRTHEAHDEGRR